MERTYEFTIGQKVRMRDPDDGEMCYGVVIDKTRDTVIIKWTDLNESCEHDRSEFVNIKLGS